MSGLTFLPYVRTQTIVTRRLTGVQGDSREEGADPGRARMPLRQRIAPCAATVVRGHRRDSHLASRASGQIRRVPTQPPARSDARLSRARHHVVAPFAHRYRFARRDVPTSRAADLLAQVRLLD